jgi:hypothetical protein
MIRRPSSASDAACSQPGSVMVILTYMLGLVFLLVASPVSAQKITGRPGAGNKVNPPRIGASVLRQIERLNREKQSWTPIQRKIEPNLLSEYKRRKGMPAFAAPLPLARVDIDADGTTLVDIEAEVTPELVQRIKDAGGVLVNSHPLWKAIRARLPFGVLEEIAASADVRSIRPAARARLRKINTSQGDVAHRANTARAQFAADGAGVMVCVISDSIESLATLQASGDLPSNVFVLPGQIGSGTSEGTALLEIIHDLAPGARLGFATVNGGEGQFAQNIIGLRNAGCDILVDDVFYPTEAVYQDGPIAAAIDQVTADGALYFSSAGNGGNLNDGTSGVWEGNYLQSSIDTGAGFAHNFGGGDYLNSITASPPFAIILQWADRQGGSANDYDLYILDANATQVLAASNAVQNGSQNPIEGFLVSGNVAGNTLLITLYSGSTRMLNLNTIGGRLERRTAGQISGHPGARSAIAVAAANVAQASSVFDSTAVVEWFSSDGPRRVFFEANGTAIPAGAQLRQKPELTAADGVATATPGLNPFFGTSASAPHAAAIAALLLSSDPPPDTNTVRDAMFGTAIDIEGAEFDRDSGHGIVDAVAAFNALNLPDLVARWLKLKPSCLASESSCIIKGRLLVANQGPATAGSSTAGIYYSADATLDPAGDTLLTTFPVSALNSGAGQTNPVRLPIPGVTNTVSGTIYVHVDDLEGLTERNEENNAEVNAGF